MNDLEEIIATVCKKYRYSDIEVRKVINNEGMFGTFNFKDIIRDVVAAALSAPAAEEGP